MRILSASEVEELTEHLTKRPDIWTFHAGAWIRKQDEDFAVALKLRNGMPGGMYALVQKGLAWSEQAADEYVLWLLENYTAYKLRMEIVNTLAMALKPTADVHILSRDLAEMQGGVFTRRKGR